MEEKKLNENCEARQLDDGEIEGVQGGYSNFRTYDVPCEFCGKTEMVHHAELRYITCERKVVSGGVKYICDRCMMLPALRYGRQLYTNIELIGGDFKEVPVE